MKSWRISLLIFFILFKYSLCKEVSIKNTTFSEFWFGRIFFLKGAGKQWAKSNGNGGAKTCADGSEVEMWLQTKTVNVRKILYNVQIHVEIEAQVTKCFGASDCFRDGFELYRYTGNGKPNVPYDWGNPANAEQEKQKSREYFKSNFTYFGNITGNTTMKERVKRTFSLIFKEFRGITFGIKSRGACGEVFRMNVYYHVCEEKFINSVMFKETLSPPNGTKVVFGNCSLNSRPELSMDSLKAYCNSNGTWSKETGTKCSCDKGYEPTTELGCTFCLDFWYKPTVANEKCIPCPWNTESAENFTKCTCTDGHYKFPKNSEKPSRCYAPLKLNNKPKIEEMKGNTNSVNVTWFPPVNNSGIDETIFYDIQCYICASKTFCNTNCTHLIRTPGPFNITETNVLVSGLVVGRRYQFRVFPKNSLNKVIPRDEWQFAASDIYTFPRIGSPSILSTVKVKTKTSISTIVLSVVVSTLVFLLVALCGILIHKRRHLRRKDTIELWQNEFVVEMSQNSEEEHNYENPDELGIVLYEEVPNVIQMDENRQDAEVQSNNLQNEELALRMEYATSDDNQTEPHEEVPNLTCSALTKVDEKIPSDPREKTLINDLVYVIPLDDQTKSQEESIAAPEKRGTRKDDSFQLELLEDNHGYLLPADGESDATRNAKISEPSAYSKLNENARDGRDIENTGNYQKLLKCESDYVIPADGEIDSSENVQILEPSAYAKLEKNRQNGRGEESVSDYQKLLKPAESDYVIPADGETDPSENVQILEPSAHAKLQKNRQNGRGVENVNDYQKLLK